MLDRRQGDGKRRRDNEIERGEIRRGRIGRDKEREEGGEIQVERNRRDKEGRRETRRE